MVLLKQKKLSNTIILHFYNSKSYQKGKESAQHKTNNSVSGKKCSIGFSSRV